MSLYERALKRMEALAGAYAQGDTPWRPDQLNHLGESASSVAKTIHHRIRGCTRGSPGEEDLLLQDDLEQLAAELRRARRDFGFPG